MIHLIFMDTSLYSCCGMESYRRQVKAVIPREGIRGPLIVPVAYLFRPSLLETHKYIQKVDQINASGPRSAYHTHS